MPQHADVAEREKLLGPDAAACTQDRRVSAFSRRVAVGAGVLTILGTLAVLGALLLIPPTSIPGRGARTSMAIASATPPSRGAVSPVRAKAGGHGEATATPIWRQQTVEAESLLALQPLRVRSSLDPQGGITPMHLEVPSLEIKAGEGRPRLAAYNPTLLTFPSRNGSTDATETLMLARITEKRPAQVLQMIYGCVACASSTLTRQAASSSWSIRTIARR